MLMIFSALSRPRARQTSMPRSYLRSKCRCTSCPPNPTGREYLSSRRISVGGGSEARRFGTPVAARSSQTRKTSSPSLVNARTCDMIMRGLAGPGIAAILGRLSHQRCHDPLFGDEVLLVLRDDLDPRRVPLLEIPFAQSLNSTSPLPLFWPRRDLSASTSFDRAEMIFFTSASSNS